MSPLVSPVWQACAAVLTAICGTTRSSVFSPRLRNCGFCAPVKKSQRPSFVDRHMIGYVTFDEVLRLILCGVVHITTDSDVRSNPLQDDPANSARF